MVYEFVTRTHINNKKQTDRQTNKQTNKQTKPNNNNACNIKREQKRSEKANYTLAAHSRCKRLIRSTELM